MALVAGAMAASIGQVASQATVTTHTHQAIPICGSGKRVTCVVDGDTIWIDREKIRLEGFNAPEVNGSCRRERELAKQATRELQRILSSAPFTVTRNGRDRYKRTLATIRNSKGDITGLMIAKGLAHEWRGRKESWC